MSASGFEAPRQVSVSEFSATPLVFDLPDASAPAGAAARAAGVFCCEPPRAGHLICWRVQGSELELSETSMVAGVELIGAHIRIRFSASLLPNVSVSQLDDGALLVSALTHAAAAGGEGAAGGWVWQLRFALPASSLSIPTSPSASPIRSWLSNSAPGATGFWPSADPVGASLGGLRSACFEGSGGGGGGGGGEGGAASQHVLLAGDEGSLSLAKLTNAFDAGGFVSVAECSLGAPSARSRMSQVIGAMGFSRGPTSLSQRWTQLALLRFPAGSIEPPLIG